MPTKVTKSASKNRTPPAVVALAHSIHALLNTVRHIAHHEDELCTLLHDAEHSDEITPALSRDLKRLLTRLPAPNTYLADVEALRTALTPPRQPALTKSKPAPKKPAPRKKRS